MSPAVVCHGRRTSEPGSDHILGIRHKDCDGLDQRSSNGDGILSPYSAILLPNLTTKLTASRSLLLASSVFNTLGICHPDLLGPVDPASRAAMATCLEIAPRSYIVLMSKDCRSFSGPTFC